MIRKAKLGQRLALYFVLLGLLFVVLTTAVASVFQYRNAQDELHSNALQTMQAVRDQLARSLWNIDDLSIQLVLQGMVRTPSIAGVKIRENLGQEYNVGEVEGHSDYIIHLSFQDERVGILELYLNHQQVMSQLIKQSRAVAISSLLLIALMSGFFLLIVRNAIVRHLSLLSNYCAKGELVAPEGRPVQLQRTDRQDELSELVMALGVAQQELQESWREQRLYEQKLEHQANYDALTGLPNRRHLEGYITEFTHNIVSQQGFHFALLFIDLDGFKEVNDSLGHSIGDKILIESATRLQQLCQQHNGYVGRFGGDEFIAVLPFEHPSQIEALAEQAIGIFKESFILQDSQIQLGCSLGIAIFPDHGQSSEELVRKADAAMYQAKNAGRNGYSFFNQEMMHDIVLRNQVKTQLKDAVSNNEFQLVYQPLINLVDGQVAGFEALLRWNNPVLGMVAPDIFIPIAEESGLIYEIDLWVLNQAQAQLAVWHQQFGNSLTMAVNFSPVNFHRRNLQQLIAQGQLIQSELAPFIELEVTERLMLNDDPIVMKTLSLLRDQGVRFSIDDFGTGYSSLGYIKKFRDYISKIKVDRMFTRELLNDAADRALVQSIITLADSLEIEVLAEGVETQAQVSALTAIGCDYAQGYYFAKPGSVQVTEGYLLRIKSA